MSTPRRVVITGVSRGLGRALAEGVIAAGHVVAGGARSAEAIWHLTQRHGPPHRFDTVDVSCDTQVQRWAGQVLQDGPPDLLVNNAALINENALLWHVPVEEFSAVVDVNLKGTFHVIRHFVPAMVMRGEGVIVNFSSTWGRTTASEVAPYCATKWAIEGLTEALAQELPRGVAAVALNPGVVDTPMLRSCLGDEAAAYPAPEAWAAQALPLLLQLTGASNGQRLTVPL